MSHLLQLVIKYYSVTEKLEILDNPTKACLIKDRKSSPSAVTKISIDLKH